jgi:allantoinase
MSDPIAGSATSTLINNPADTTVFAPDLPREFDGHRAPLSLPEGKKLAVGL